MKAFISYTREKDQYGVVSAFRERLLNELRLRKKSAEIFLDQAVIASGASFPQSIRDALASANVLIVLLSPAWMESEWCRKELEDFVDIKSGAGKFPYVLPLLWVKTNLSEYPNDKIADFLAPLQYRDWRNLRKKKWESEELRDELDSLADALFELARVS
jgi:hypothetical protein